MKNIILPAWLLSILLALMGCGSSANWKGDYPNAWSSRVPKAGQADCLDISGTYRAVNGDSQLPFYLYGISHRSADWSGLIDVVEKILAAPGDSTVSIGYTEPNQIEVVVSVRGMPIGRQMLTRQSGGAAKIWSGDPPSSFRCEPESVVILGANVFNWDEYRSGRQNNRCGRVGISYGYYGFAKAIDGSLVMLERPYATCGRRGLDDQWLRWAPAPGRG